MKYLPSQLQNKSSCLYRRLHTFVAMATTLIIHCFAFNNFSCTPISKSPYMCRRKSKVDIVALVTNSNH